MWKRLQKTKKVSWMLEQRIETSMKIETKAKKNKAVMKEFNKEFQKGVRRDKEQY